MSSKLLQIEPDVKSCCDGIKLRVNCTIWHLRTELSCHVTVASHMETYENFLRKYRHVFRQLMYHTQKCHAQNLLLIKDSCLTQYLAFVVSSFRRFVVKEITVLFSRVLCFFYQVLKVFSELYDYFFITQDEKVLISLQSS